MASTAAQKGLNYETELHRTQNDQRKQTRCSMIELLNQQLADLLDLGAAQLVNALRVKVAEICKLSNLLPQRSTRTQ
jgi:hypothetical protein